MRVIVLKSAAQVGEEVGKIFCDAVNAKHNSVLGLATGASPIPTYEYMIEQYRSGKVSFKDVKTFNLDEYCDLPKAHPNSFYSFMEENLFSKVDIAPENINFLDGNTEPVAESARYARAIKAAGGIDIQLLGIGRNGHIGFNEPADEFTDEAFKVRLTDSTIAANSNRHASLRHNHGYRIYNESEKNHSYCNRRQQGRSYKGNCGGRSNSALPGIDTSKT